MSTRDSSPPSKIAPGLYVGGKDYDPSAGWVPFDLQSFPEGGYVRSSRIERVVREITKAWRAGGLVLIHCAWGRGRAPLIAAAVFIREYGSTPAVAEGLVKSGRTIANLSRSQKESLDDYFDWLVDRRIL